MAWKDLHFQMASKDAVDYILSSFLQLFSPQTYI